MHIGESNTFFAHQIDFGEVINPRLRATPAFEQKIQNKRGRKK